jgi:hypothetical protein
MTTCPSCFRLEFTLTAADVTVEGQQQQQQQQQGQANTDTDSPNTDSIPDNGLAGGAGQFDVSARLTWTSWPPRSRFGREKHSPERTVPQW